MTARDIAYVELYTSNPQSATDYFVSSLGFTRVAESVEDYRTSVLLRQGETQVLVTSGPATWKFLDAHGDGIADIALACADVAETLDAALVAGARAVDSVRGNPIVSGFGDVCHTLVPCTEDPGTALPAGRVWSPASATPSRPAGRIMKLDHIAICLEGGSLVDQSDFYRNAFGFFRYSSEYVAVGEQAMDSIVVRSPGRHATFTLVAPDPARSPGQLDAFLERNGGPGVQHLAFLVDDIVPAVHESRERGVEFLSTPGSYYDMLKARFAEMPEAVEDLQAAQVLADRDEWGYLLQIFSRSPYERNTLFFEFIQRQGSRGFGSANIRALYEAVERDRLEAE